MDNPNKDKDSDKIEKFVKDAIQELIELGVLPENETIRDMSPAEFVTLMNKIFGVNQPLRITPQPFEINPQPSGITPQFGFITSQYPYVDYIEVIEKTVLTVLEAYIDSVCGRELTPDDFLSIERLLGKNSRHMQVNVMARYILKLTELDKGDTSGEKYLNYMNHLVNYVFDEINTNSRFTENSPYLEQFFTIINTLIFDFCDEHPIENLSPKSLECVERLFRGIAKCRYSPTIFLQFEKLEEKLNANGKSFSRDTKEQFLNTAVHVKQILRQYNLDDKKLERSIDDLENHFLRYASSQLESGSIDDIWNDNIVNLILQLRNTNRVSEKNPDNPDLIRLNKAAKTFCENNYTPEEVAKLNRIVSDWYNSYTSPKIENPKTQEDFERAYKKLYLYELVSDKQRDSTSYSSNIDLLILKNIRLFEKSNIDVEKLALRSSQSALVKEVYKENKESPLVVAFDQNYLYNNSLSTVHMDSDSIMISDGLISEEDNKDTIIKSIFHEMDHYIKGIKGECTSYDEYKARKVAFAIRNDANIRERNYSNLYTEVSANCAGALAEIRLLSKLPKRNENVEEEKKERIKEIKNKLDSTIGNKLKRRNRYSGNLGSDYDVLVIDDVYFDEVSLHKEVPAIFAFEYKEYAEPKSLDEIILDQACEFDGEELNPPCGPKDLVERAKLRFQIMMERAMATHEEEECYLSIMEFVKSHKEQFKNDSLFQIDFTLDFDQLIDKQLIDGKKEGFENALFLYRLQALEERVIDKKRFGESVFFFYREVFGLNQKLEEKESADTQSDPIPE